MRRVAVTVVMLGYLSVVGCTSLQPVLEQPTAAGTVLSLEINDAGRVALNAQMGASLKSIEGKLLERDSASYVLAVSQVETLRGDTQVWSGERVRVNKEYVNIAQQRRFSRSRTALVSAAAVGLVAILATQGIIGSVAGDDTKLPGDTAVSIKIPLFIRR